MWGVMKAAWQAAERRRRALVAPECYTVVVHLDGGCITLQRSTLPAARRAAEAQWAPGGRAVHVWAVAGTAQALVATYSGEGWEEVEHG